MLISAGPPDPRLPSPGSAFSRSPERPVTCLTFPRPVDLRQHVRRLSTAAGFGGGGRVTCGYNPSLLLVTVGLFLCLVCTLSILLGTHAWGVTSCTSAQYHPWFQASTGALVNVPPWVRGVGGWGKVGFVKLTW